jgi:hypothetical protein
MEQYYFIVKNGTKLGPYKLSELKQKTVYFDELIWRSDSDQWRKAADYEELSDIFIIKPPPTPKEQKIAEVNKNFIGQIIGLIAISYVITSVFIGLISFVIAQDSWNSYLKETESKYVPDKNPSYNYQYPSGGGFVMANELIDNKRYPMYQRGVNLENVYGIQQGLLFRSFRAFYSTIYLTKKEQNNSVLFLMNLMLSSFVSLSFFFIAIGIIYYAIKRNDLVDKPANMESIN